MTYSSPYSNASAYNAKPYGNGSSAHSAYSSTGSSTSTFDRYLEAEVMSADPVKLINMLYRGALEAVGAARRALAAGDIPLRSKQIVKAWDIVRELDSTLNHDAGGNLSRQLSELYAYAGQRLMEANAEQSDAKLTEVEVIVTTLAEAWRGVQSAAPVIQQTAVQAGEYRPISQAC